MRYCSLFVYWLTITVIMSYSMFQNPGKPHTKRPIYLSRPMDADLTSRSRIPSTFAEVERISYFDKVEYLSRHLVDKGFANLGLIYRINYE